MEDLRPEVTVSSFSDDDVRECVEKLNKIEKTYGGSQPIIINIASYGGSIYGLSYLYEYLKTLTNPIITYTNSKAMSAGAILLSAAGSPGLRFASPNSSILIHEIQAGLWTDDIKNVENAVESLKNDNDKWMTILAKSMGMKSSKDIRSLIKDRAIGHDLMLTAREAKELKIVDEVAYIKFEPVFGYNLLVNPEVKQVVPEIKKPKKGVKK